MLSQATAIARPPRQRIHVVPRALGTAAIIALAVVIALAWLAITKSAGTASLQQTSQLRTTQAADLTSLLTRSGSSADDSTVDVTLATPDFFQLTDRTDEEAQLGADGALVFVANENTHYSDLIAHFAPILRVDGAQTYAPTEVRVLADAVHHRRGRRHRTR